MVKSGLYFPTVIKARINLGPEHLTRNFLDEMLPIIEKKFSGQIYPSVGYIKPGSIKLISRSQGKIEPNQFTGSVTYNIEIAVEVFRPMKGMKLTRCRVTDKERKIGIIAKPTGPLPYVIFLPILTTSKDQISELSVGDLINVTVLDSKLLPPNKDRQNSVYWTIATNVEIIDEDQLINYRLPKSQDSLSFAVVLADDYEGVDRNTYIEGDYTAEQLNAYKNEIIEDINDRAVGTMNGLIRKGNKFWDSHMKLFVNDYELVSVMYKPYVDLVKRKTRQKVPIANVISRAYYKMYELYNTQFDDLNMILGDYLSDDLNVLNLGEAPGGFIQAILHNRLSTEKHSDILGVSITTASLTSKKTVSTWAKLTSILERDDRVVVYQNEDPEEQSQRSSVRLYDRDLFDEGMLEYAEKYFVTKNGKKAELITADGRDEIKNLDDEEMIMYKLLFTEIVYAVCCQAEDGVFILKIYDMFTDFTCKLIQYLTQMYNMVYVTKPHTSRSASSEKYLVCVEFNPPSQAHIEELKQIWTQWVIRDEGDQVVVDLFNESIDPELAQSIKEYNGNGEHMFIHKQIMQLKSGEGYTDLHLKGDTGQINEVLTNRFKEQIENAERWRSTYNFIQQQKQQKSQEEETDEQKTEEEETTEAEVEDEEEEDEEEEETEEEEEEEEDEE